MSEKFIKGMYVKDAHENAPDFVLGQISLKREEVIEDLSQRKDEWINLDIKRSQEDEIYYTINTWKKEEDKKTVYAKKEDTIDYPEDEDITPEDIPF